MIGLKLKRPDLVGVVDRLLLLRRLWRWHLPLRGGNQWLNSVLLASLLAKFKHSFVRRSDRFGSPDIRLSCYWSQTIALWGPVSVPAPGHLTAGWWVLGAKPGQHTPANAAQKYNITSPNRLTEHQSALELGPTCTPYETHDQPMSPCVLGLSFDLVIWHILI